MRVLVAVPLMCVLALTAVVIVLVGVPGLQKANAPSQGHAQRQGQRQPQPVVRMKRDFGQKIRQRNAEEHTRGKSKRTTQHEVLLAQEAIQA